MSVEPYIEAPYERTTIQPTSGGIDIGSFLNVQGTSVSDPFRKHSALLPHFSSGNEESIFEVSNFGVSKRHEDGVPFSDEDRFVAEKYLQYPAQFSTDIGEYLPEDGAIEALTIRSVATRETIEDPVAHEVRGALMDGNLNLLNKTDRKLDYYMIKDVKNVAFFLDSTDEERFTAVDVEEMEFPFVEGDPDPFMLSNGDGNYGEEWGELTFGDETQSLDTGMNAVLLGMNRRVQDHLLPNGARAATRGFVWANAEGTDSIAFGGLKR